MPENVKDVFGHAIDLDLQHELGNSLRGETEPTPFAKEVEAPMTFAVKLAPNKLDRLQSMRRYRAPFPPGFGFDRDEVNAR